MKLHLNSCSVGFWSKRTRTQSNTDLDTVSFGSSPYHASTLCSSSPDQFSATSLHVTPRSNPYMYPGMCHVGNPDVICEVRVSRILTDLLFVSSCLRPSGLMGEVYSLVLGWQTQLSSLKSTSCFGLDRIRSSEVPEVQD